MASRECYICRGAYLLAARCGLLLDGRAVHEECLQRDRLAREQREYNDLLDIAIYVEEFSKPDLGMDSLWE